MILYVKKMEYQLSDIIKVIVSQIESNFDFSFTLVIVVFTYILIKGFDALNGNDIVTTWEKRIFLLCSIFIVGCWYYILSDDTKIQLLNSAILSPVAWSWIFKPICKFFKIDYKKIDDTLKFK